jgi:hypothetical protein
MKDYYKIDDRVSNSSLGWFQISPKFFKAKLDGLEEESKSYFERGQRIHMYLLEPEEFHLNYVISNMEIPKSDNERKFCYDYIMSEGSTNGEKALDAYVKNYAVTGTNPEIIAAKGLDKVRKLDDYIEFLKSKKPQESLIKIKEFEWYVQIDHLVKRPKKANELIYPRWDPLLNVDSNVEVLTEFMILFDYSARHHGIKMPCKALLDRVIIDHNNKVIKLVDLKTTRSLGEFPRKSFIEYDYGRQLSWYEQALDQYVEKRVDAEIVRNYKREAYIVAVSTDPQVPGVEVFKVEKEVLQERAKFIDQLIEQIAWHWTKDEWEHPREYYESAEGVITIGGEAQGRQS